MIVTRLSGGLGNQLFQYCVGLNLGRLNSDIVKVDINRFSMPEENRQYCLDLIFPEVQIASHEEVTSFTKPKRIFGIFNIAGDRRLIVEKGFSFDPGILKQKGPAYLQGFWQSEKYFIGLKEFLQKTIILKRIESSDLYEFYLNKIKFNNSVCLFVRRAELVTNQKYRAYHGYCDLDYYKRGISFLNQKLENPFYLIFSDDLSWCIENFSELSNSIIVPHDVAGDRFVQYFMLMKECQNFIISNSTYSWWAAWLASNNEKTVVAPKSWFNEAKHSTEDLIPADWVQL